MTTAKDIAARLDGLHPDFLDEEASFELRQEAKDAGLVIVYRTDDTWVSMEGAIQAEAYGDEPFFVHAGGLAPTRQMIIEQTSELLEDELTAELEEMLALRRRSVRVIAVKHCEADAEFALTFETTIPHETFSQPVDGKPWSQGIVFALADAVPPSPTWEPYIVSSAPAQREATRPETASLDTLANATPFERGQIADVANKLGRQDLRITVSGRTNSGKTTVAQAIEALLRSYGLDVIGDAWAAKEGILDKHRDGTLMKVLAKRGVKIEIVEQQQQRFTTSEGQGDR